MLTFKKNYKWSIAFPLVFVVSNFHILMYFLISPACSVVFKRASFLKFKFVAHFSPGDNVFCGILCWGGLFIPFISEIYILWEWRGFCFVWERLCFSITWYYTLYVSLLEVVHSFEKVLVVFPCFCFIVLFIFNVDFLEEESPALSR